jgi:hypothetical protein
MKPAAGEGFTREPDRDSVLTEKPAILPEDYGILLAGDLQKEFPGISGFSASNLWRMKNLT